MSDNPYESRRDDQDQPMTDPVTADVPAPGTADDDARPDVPTDREPVTASSPLPTHDGEPAPATDVGGGTATWPAEPVPASDSTGAPDPAVDDATSTYDARDTDRPATDDTSTSTYDARDTDSSVGDATTSTYDARDGDRPAGTHQAERPVPRSGLSEHQSAGYLTGERAAPRSEPAAGTTAHDPAPWLAGGAAGAAATTTGHEREQEHDRTGSQDRERDAALLDGATVTAKPPSRGRAHVWAVLVSLLLTPVVWYLLADAGARLTLPSGNPWETGDLNIAALLELAGGLLVLVVVLLAARWSSLGAIITGSLVLIVGVPFVAVPAWTQEVLEPAAEWLQDLGAFGSNVAHHLVASGSTGRLVVYGLALILIGVVSHGARRQGRREARFVPAA